MRLARQYFVVSAIVALVTSCAQVGTISGGDQDVFAPAPVKFQPDNASTLFSGQDISITFDEYFTLVSPAQNIVMIPPHATINSSIKKKTLMLSWEDTLQANTTYSIYLNGAVADITEKNDSVYQYVFSTGNELDSISYTSFLSHARTGEPAHNATLLCYGKDGELTSLGRAHSLGEVNINYLKPASYSFIALEDANNNLEIDEGEVIGFPDFTSIELNQSRIDSTLIRMFRPKELPRLRTAKFSAPGMILIGATEEFKASKIFLDGDEIETNLVQQIEVDSLHVFPKNTSSGYHELVVQSELFTDTINFRIPKTIDSTIHVTSLNEASGIAPSEQLSYKTNDRILSVNKDSLRLFNESDSSYILDFDVTFEHDRLYLDFDRTQIRDIKVLFGEGAIICATGTSNAWTNNVVLNESRSYGQLIIDHSAYTESIIIELHSAGRIVRSIAVDNTSDTHVISELSPGNYTIHVIVDSNNNGRWDTGSLEDRRQPEEIDRYTTPVAVRANWELEVPLEPKKE